MNRIGVSVRRNPGGGGNGHILIFGLSTSSGLGEDSKPFFSTQWAASDESLKYHRIQLSPPIHLCAQLIKHDIACEDSVQYPRVLQPQLVVSPLSSVEHVCSVSRAGTRKTKAKQKVKEFPKTQENPSCLPFRMMFSSFLQGGRVEVGRVGLIEGQLASWLSCAVRIQG